MDDRGRPSAFLRCRQGRSGHCARLVRALSEQEKLELALIDNLQRHDLNRSEEAVAMARIVDYGLTAAALAKRIGRSATYVRDRF